MPAPYTEIMAFSLSLLLGWTLLAYGQAPSPKKHTPRKPAHSQRPPLPSIDADSIGKNIPDALKTPADPFLRKMVQETPPVGQAQPVPTNNHCKYASVPAKPLPLGSPTDYLKTKLTFQTEDGQIVHVSSNKDVDQNSHSGYFFFFYIEGQPLDWVKAKTGRTSFQIRNRRYFLELPGSWKLAITDRYRIPITITREGDEKFKKKFSSGELTKAVQDTGPQFFMLGKEYHATDTPRIWEDKNMHAPLTQPNTHNLLITTYDAFYDKDDDGAPLTWYKFDESKGIHLKNATEIMGPDRVYERIMGANKRIDGRDVPVKYGFHINEQHELEICDITGNGK